MYAARYAGPGEKMGMLKHKRNRDSRLFSYLRLRLGAEARLQSDRQAMIVEVQRRRKLAKGWLAE